MLHIRERSLGHVTGRSGQVDIIAGQLPTPKATGGGRKIFLGAVDSFRRSMWWRISWGIGAFVCMGSLIATYVILKQAPASAVNLWVAFQLLWLALRFIFYYFSEPADPMAYRMMVSRSWDSLSTPMKERVINLTLALSKHQVQVHPRGTLAYRQDSLSAQQLTNLLSRPALHVHLPLGSTETLTEVNVLGVVGDVVLSSAAWITGSTLTGMDLYDSCIVVLSLSSPPGSHATKTFAIPSARVLSGPTSYMTYDIESSTASQFVPKGTSNLGYKLTWWYWIPCTQGTWLQIRSDDAMGILGRRKVEVLTDEELTRKLAMGNLNISFAHAQEVKEAVNLSRSGRDILAGLGVIEA